MASVCVLVLFGVGAVGWSLGKNEGERAAYSLVADVCLGDVEGSLLVLESVRGGELARATKMGECQMLMSLNCFLDAIDESREYADMARVRGVITGVSAYCDRNELFTAENLLAPQYRSGSRSLEALRERYAVATGMIRKSAIDVE
jgi:hypothetical protein